MYTIKIMCTCTMIMYICKFNDCLLINYVISACKIFFFFQKRHSHCKILLSTSYVDSHDENNCRHNIVLI